MKDVDTLVSELVQVTRKKIQDESIEDPMMIGIHTGGAWVAERLHEGLALKTPLGALNISFYRDDFTRIGMHPQVTPSHLPASVEDRNIILVDDVLYTGRTIRAALNEIFDYGRPRRVILVCLVERSGRELPIQADIVGEYIELATNQQVKLAGPQPLNLSIVDAAT
ncbi:MAG: bifunctional pyr operon transcriptional regulator/uracil phosphoribosyltransferase PyrR [Gammaproteobacteria bacterium]|nr:bifunctional pyr operon transcriptional regulator/uracil phosphoribosyltransferase PyrR [Gammaproteobacteria bacterium]MDH5692252.1 bifunctional pyr operon transcriptional regulator/uracil phosphoribosyltransferase PyrR [Gammaproteobacteria bacterium]